MQELDALSWATLVGVPILVAWITAFGTSSAVVRQRLAKLETNIEVIANTIRERRPFVSNHEKRISELERTLSAHLVELEKRLSEIKHENVEQRNAQTSLVYDKMEALIRPILDDLRKLREEVRNSPR